MLSIDLVGGDRRLTFGRGEPVDKLHGQCFFHMGLLCGVDEHHAVLIEKPGIAFNEYHEFAAILE